MDWATFSAVVDKLSVRLERHLGVLVVCSGSSNFDPAIVRAWRQTLSARETERMLNHRHMANFFGYADWQPSIDELRSLARVWCGVLRGAAAAANVNLCIVVQEPPDVDDVVVDCWEEH